MWFACLWAPETLASHLRGGAAGLTGLKWRLRISDSAGDRCSREGLAVD